MKVRAFFSTLVIVVVALLVVGVGGFVGLTSRGPLALLSVGGQEVPTATPFVPKNAPVMVSLLTRPDHLSDLWLRLAAPQNRREAQAEVSRLEKSLLAGTGLTYENDIRPWLGNEITFAVTDADLDRNPDNGNQPGYLLVMSCRDSERAKAVLELFWQKRAIAGDSLVFEQFAGSRLIYGQQLAPQTQQPAVDEAPKTIASALVGQQFLLLANNPSVIQRALTAAQARDLNLDQDLAYRKALASFPSNRLALAVVNVPASLNWLGLSAQPTLALAANELGIADGVFDRAVLSLRPHRHGLLADTALLAAAGHPFQPQTVATESSAAVEAAGQFLPADTPLAAVGTDLNQLWQTVRQTLPYYAAAAPALQPLWEHLQAPLAHQPTDSLLGWIQNEYALGLVSGSLAAPGWVLAAQPPQGTPIAKQLDQLAQKQGLSVGPLELGGQQVTAWTHLSVVPSGTAKGGRRAAEALSVATEVDGLHTQLNGYELLSNSPTALYQALQSSDRSLLDASHWKEMTAAFSQPNGGYFYLDWQTLKPDLLSRTPWLRLIETVGQPLLSHLQAVAVTSYGQDEQVQSGGVFLRLSSS